MYDLACIGDLTINSRIVSVALNIHLILFLATSLNRSSERRGYHVWGQKMMVLRWEQDQSLSKKIVAEMLWAKYMLRTI